MFIRRLGSRLELRQLRVEEAEQVFAVVDRDRADLRRWLPWLDQSTRVEDTVAYIASAEERAAREEGLDAGIWRGEELAGVISFHIIDWANRSTSIGYWLSVPHRGQGLMTRACRAMVDHAIAELRLHRVEVRCALGNFPSRSIPERLGFRQEGILREAEFLYDHFVDLVVYAMLATEWPHAAA